MALPLLKPAMENDEALGSTIEVIHQELTVSDVPDRIGTGIADLRKAPDVYYRAGHAR